MNDAMSRLIDEMRRAFDDLPALRDRVTRLETQNDARHMSQYPDVVGSVKAMEDKIQDIKGENTRRYDQLQSKIDELIKKIDVEKQSTHRLEWRTGITAKIGWILLTAAIGAVLGWLFGRMGF